METEIRTDGRGEIVATRDPVGVTPLYVDTRPGARSPFWIQVPGKRAPWVKSTSVDPLALRDYLACAFVPGRHTLFSGVEKVRPGETIRFSPTGARFTRTEGAAFDEGEWDDDAPMDSHAARLRPILETVISEQLPENGEPVGVYLSGGLDSSLVTALVKRLHDGPVHTFAIHFGADYRNELEFSQMVADHCGTIHHVIEIPTKTIRERLEESLRPFHDPVGDPLTTPNYILGESAKRLGLSTIFNGEGGDPVFGGPKNLPMVLHALYDGDDSDPGDSRAAYFRSYQKCYDDLPELLSPEMRTVLAGAPPQTDLLAEYLDDDQARMRSYLNRLMLVNVRLKGADHILTKVATLTGHFGLRGQSPLFDHRVVAAGFAIPARYKLDGTTEKAVLKRAVADLLPEPILTRPKSGMMVPVQRWFRADLNRFARDILLSRKSRIGRYLDKRALKDWLDFKPQPYPRHGVKIWLALTLEFWLRENEPN